MTKTISGKVVSTAPTSLSRAAKVISNFASFDNGASDPVSVYLKRASEAFDALVQFHKDLKTPHHSTHKKHKKHNMPVIHQPNSYNIKHEGESEDVENIPKKENADELVRIVEDGGFEEKKKRKKHRKEKFDKEEDLKIERDDGGDVNVENAIKNEKELEEEEEEEEGGVKKSDKKKRKRKSEGEERFEVEQAKENEKKKKKKGNKSGEEGVDSAEQSHKKKRKRIKVEGKD